MSRLDTLAADARRAALASPLTRANAPVLPAIELPDGVLVGLSVNL